MSFPAFVFQPMLLAALAAPNVSQAVVQAYWVMALGWMFSKPKFTQRTGDWPRLTLVLFWIAKVTSINESEPRHGPASQVTWTSDNVQVSAVPEPKTYALLASGAILA